MPWGSGEPWRDIEPYDEVGGLEAALVGPLHTILDRLEKHRQTLGKPASPKDWIKRMVGLMTDFFLPTTRDDQLTQRLLDTVLEDWERACADAGLEDPLTLPVVCDVVLGAMKDASLSQRFLAGMVNFCTLMPMRAIPFKVVCLLGINDGEYPRGIHPMDFDLMAASGRYRPGDRSHREDDRYLFLEALLSAREKLYISYIARNVTDNSERMPSVLVSQLRDYLAGGWEVEDVPPGGNATGDPRDLLDQLTCPHPLQPFSKAYFLPGGPRDLFTYAREWREMLASRDHTPDQGSLSPARVESRLALTPLIRFLKNPVKGFFNERLNVYFDDTGVVSHNREPFALDGLAPFNLGNTLLNAGLAVRASESVKAVNRAAQRLQRTGELPPGGFGQLSAEKLTEPVLRMLEHHHGLAARYPHPCSPLEIGIPIGIEGCDCEMLEDWLDGLRGAGLGTSAATTAAEYARWEFYPKDILDAKNRVSRLDSLVGLWVKHLAGCAGGLALTSILVAPDGMAQLPPLDRGRAGGWLAEIMATWWHGLSQPLPVTAKTALTYLKTLISNEGEDAPQKAWEAARKAYEGDGYHFPGELGYGDGVYLKRCYPDFDALWQAENGRFETSAEKLYEPLIMNVFLFEGPS